MGRTILADDGVQSCLNSVNTGGKCAVGLILGQITAQRDYALHLSPCPDAGDTEEKAKTTSLDSLQEKWVATHARQVLRMLPGGLNVLGIFAQGSPDSIKGAQAKLRQVLFAVEKILLNEEPARYSADGMSDRVLLQICAVSNKLTCRTFDVTDPKSAAKPAEWKAVSKPEKFHRLQTELNVDYVIPVTKPATSHSLENQILQGLQPVCDNVLNSLTLMNGALLPLEGALVESTSGSGKVKGKKPAGEVVEQTLSVELFDRTTCRQEDDDEAVPELIDCAAKLCVRGRVCCRAFVHSRATGTEGQQALKTDAVRSLLSRCQLLCEDLLQTEEEQDVRVVYETPVRVFANLPGRSVQVCDYMFQDESASDSTDRFKELLSMTLEDEDLELDCERVPEDDDLEKPEKEVRERHASGSPAPVQPKRTSNLLIAAAGLFVAGLAAAVTFFIQD